MSESADALYEAADSRDRADYLAETNRCGHECGHQFVIEVRSIGHHGLAGHGPEEHTDEKPWTTGVVTTHLTVRAHSLSQAMRRAAQRSLADWEVRQDGKPTTEEDD